MESRNSSPNPKKRAMALCLVFSTFAWNYLGGNLVDFRGY